MGFSVHGWPEAVLSLSLVGYFRVLDNFPASLRIAFTSFQGFRADLDSCLSLTVKLFVEEEERKSS